MKIKRVNRIIENLEDEDGNVIARAEFVPTSATFIVELQAIHNGFKELVNKVTDIDNATRDEIVELSSKLRRDLNNCFGNGVAEALQQGSDDFAPVVEFLAWVKSQCDISSNIKSDEKESIIAEALK